MRRTIYIFSVAAFVAVIFGCFCLMQFDAAFPCPCKARIVCAAGVWPLLVNYAIFSLLSVCASFFHDAASWDGAVKMWDGKQPNPVWQQNVGAKVRKRGALTNRVVLGYQPAASQWLGLAKLR